MQISLAGKGIKPNRVGCVVFDAMKVRFQQIAQRDLTALRDIDQLTEFVDEEIDAVSLEALFGQRMPRRKMLLKVINPFTDLA